MSCQMRIQNLFFAFATFALGVGFASLFLSEELSSRPIDIGSPTFEYRSEGCSAAPASRRGRGIYDTERENAVASGIHFTERELIEVKKRNSIYSPTIEAKMERLQRRLEAKLKRLFAERTRLVRERERLEKLSDKAESTELVHRQYCYEN